MISQAAWNALDELELIAKKIRVGETDWACTSFADNLQRFAEEIRAAKNANDLKYASRKLGRAFLDSFQWGSPWTIRIQELTHIIEHDIKKLKDDR